MGIKYLDCRLVLIQVHKMGSDFLRYKFFSLMHDDFLACFKCTQGILLQTPAVIIFCYEVVRNDQKWFQIV